LTKGIGGSCATGNAWLDGAVPLHSGPLHKLAWVFGFRRGG